MAFVDSSSSRCGSTWLGSRRSAKLCRKKTIGSNRCSGTRNQWKGCLNHLSWRNKTSWRWAKIPSVRFLFEHLNKEKNGRCFYPSHLDLNSPEFDPQDNALGFFASSMLWKNGGEQWWWIPWYNSSTITHKKTNPRIWKTFNQRYLQQDPLNGTLTLSI